MAPSSGQPAGQVALRIVVRAAREVSRLSVVGNASQMGQWDVAASVPLAFDQEECAGGAVVAPRLHASRAQLHHAP